MGLLLRTKEEVWQELANYRCYPAKEEEEPRHHINRAIARSSQVSYVSGEADDKMFDTTEFKDAVEMLLNRGGTFRLVFHRDPDKSTALDELAKAENEVLKTLVEQPSDKGVFELYHFPERPRCHYATFDDKEVMIEREHQPGEQRKAEFFLHPKMAREIRVSFEELIGHLNREPVQPGDFPVEAGQ